MFAADLTFLVTYVLLAAAGFRVSVRWGLVLLLAPLGGLFFCISHWREGGKLYLLKLVAYFALFAILLNNPALLKEYEHLIPYSSRIANQLAKEEQPHPSEVVDQAANDAETPPAPAPSAVPVDRHAAERAALARHAAELNTIYTELNKERANLRKGSPEVAAFNAKAAKYQEGLKSLAAEQARLSALDRPAAPPTR